MNKDINKLANQFIDLAAAKKSQTSDLALAEIETLLQLVKLAGFNAEKIIPGKIIGTYHDDDDSPTHIISAINSLLKYKVIGHNHEDMIFATGWLECVYCHTAILPTHLTLMVKAFNNGWWTK